MCNILGNEYIDMYAVNDHDYHYLIYIKEVLISKERLTRKFQDDKNGLVFLIYYCLCDPSPIFRAYNKL